MKKIKKKISRYNNSGRSGRKILYIVIHWVGAVSTAKNNADYFAGGNRNASAHLFVDDTSIWQSVLLSMAAWHCGGGLQGSGGHAFYGKCNNSNSIGIEMCCKRKNGKLYITDKTIKNTAELVRHLLKLYPDAKVIRHYDVTGKSCPAPYLDATKWSSLKKILLGTNTPKDPKKPSKSKLVVPKKNIAFGSKGLNVRRLQRCLNKIMGTNLKIDGSWGPATEKAFREFQRNFGLKVDGSCGPKSRAKLNKLI